MNVPSQFFYDIQYHQISANCTSNLCNEQITKEQMPKGCNDFLSEFIASAAVDELKELICPQVNELHSLHLRVKCNQFLYINEVI